MGWQETQATHRRFPTARSNRGRRAAFDVSSTFGTYEVKCPRMADLRFSPQEEEEERQQRLPLASSSSPPSSSSKPPSPVSGKKGKKGSFGSHDQANVLQAKMREKERDGDGGSNGSGMGIEIHETTRDGRGIVASFSMGDMQGIMLIAGSRKALAEVVEDASNDGRGARWRRGSAAGGRRSGNAEPSPSSSEAEDDDDDDDDEDDGNEANQPVNEDNFEPPPPSSHASPFEKNTHRTPKFWFRYRARLLSSGALVADAPSNMGFIEFDGNACRGFKGVITSERVGENVPFEGWKIKGRATGSRWSWGDFA